MENLVPLSGEEYNEIFVKPWKSSEYNRRCDMSFHSAQAESVPVQPTTSSDNASGGSRPDGTSATANSSSAQAGYAVAPGVAQVNQAMPPPHDAGPSCFAALRLLPPPRKQKQPMPAPKVLTGPSTIKGARPQQTTAHTATDTTADADGHRQPTTTPTASGPPPPPSRVVKYVHSTELVTS